MRFFDKITRFGREEFHLLRSRLSLVYCYTIYIIIIIIISNYYKFKKENQKKKISVKIKWN